MRTAEKHLAAIRAGTVTKSNVIGIRKAFNAFERDRRNYSNSSTAPRMSADDYSATERALRENPPRVAGELHDGGLKVLRNPRYAKRLAHYAPAIASIDHFKLVGFEWIDATHCVPIYAVWSHVPPVAGRDPFPPGATYEAFRFRNVPWQSGGDGPEIV
jgi:hypothetical protein